MQKIGKYEVVQLIGTGGFGSVYEGRDPVIKRRVAIKTCTSDEEETRQSFHHAAEIARRLEHRNIAAVFDFGLEGEVPYLVQEYLAGADLDRLIARREPLSLQHQLDILLQVLRGLEHAHALGVLHGALAPGAIRLLDDGRVKIIDFGIARLKKAENARAKSGTAAGIIYLSPEQLRGELLDARSDLYSWGVVAYELLTHERPFTGTRLPDLQSNILGQPPTPLTRHWRDCPPPLERLVLRCLEKDRAQRFATAAEVAATLEPLLAGGDPEATRLVLPVADRAAAGAEIAAAPRAPLGPAADDGALSAEELAALAVIGEAPAPPPPSPNDTQPAPAPAETPGASRPVFVEPPPLPAPPTAPQPLALRRREPGKRRGGRWLAMAAVAAFVLAGLGVLGGLLAWRALRDRREAAAPAPAMSAPGPAPPSRAVEVAPPPAELLLPGSEVPGLAVAMDGGVPVPLTGLVRFELPPGPHTLHFSAPGHRAREVTVQLQARETRRLELPVMERASPPPRRPPRRRPAAPPPPPAPAPAPPAPQRPPVERGELVEAGPGVVAPQRLEIPSPRAVSGRKLPAELEVTVSVLVDENGRVVELRLEDARDAPAPFAAASLDAARRATFRPATKDGVPVKMWTTLRYRFRAR